MILIAHRGNTHGQRPELENSPGYILQAIRAGFEVEVDVWFVDGKFKLGHDKPDYDFPFSLLEDYYRYLWIHCKDVESFSKLNEIDKIGTRLNYFFHDTDRGVLTSQGYIWSVEPLNRGILVMPESTFSQPVDSTIGICSDYVSKYR